MLTLENKKELANDPVKVTIGVCVKNGALTIGKAIESVMVQDFPHELMEIIFVDDGSEDQTLSVIKNYIPKLDMRVTVFHHSWKGLGASRNIIVDNAAGEYIIWLDADMILEKSFVTKQVEFMEKNLEVAVGKGQYGIYSQENLVGFLENIEFATAHFKRREKSDNLTFGTGGSIYRTKAIRQVGGFDPFIKGAGEDADAEHRLRMAGWLLVATSAVFYEKRRETWRSLWEEYFWFGKGGSKLIEKNKQVIPVYRLWPPIALVIEFSRVILAYKLTRQKLVFLLPIHYIFKRTAWFLGFVRNRRL